MFKFRAISFPVLLALFFAMIFWEDGGPYLFLILCGALTFGLAWDACSMLGMNGSRSYRMGTAVMTSLFFVCAGLNLLWPRWPLALWSLLAVATLFAAWGGLLAAKDKLTMFGKSVTSFGISLMLLMTFVPLLAIYGEHPIYFMFLVLVTKSMDTGGYIAGMLSARWMKNGNHKILPKISPKKSWEGTLGGIALSVLVALIFFWCESIPGKDLLWCVVAGVILALGSFAGDLTESALKRGCGVKDSGNYIPGMGGAFDVLDSFIYNGLLFYLLLLI